MELGGHVPCARSGRILRSLRSRRREKGPPKASALFRAAPGGAGSLILERSRIKGFEVLVHVNQTRRGRSYGAMPEKTHNRESVGRRPAHEILIRFPLSIDLMDA